jgi:phosphocarrier protein HPr
MNQAKSILIEIKGMNEARDFCNMAGRYSFDLDLRQDRYVVDAKSILGILSLNLSKPIFLDAYTEDVSALYHDLAKYLAQ